MSAPATPAVAAVARPVSAKPLAVAAAAKPVAVAAAAKPVAMATAAKPVAQAVAAAAKPVPQAVTAAKPVAQAVATAKPAAQPVAKPAKAQAITPAAVPAAAPAPAGGMTRTQNTQDMQQFTPAPQSTAALAAPAIPAALALPAAAAARPASAAAAARPASAAPPPATPVSAAGLLVAPAAPYTPGLSSTVTSAIKPQQRRGLLSSSSTPAIGRLPSDSAPVSARRGQRQLLTPSASAVFNAPPPDAVSFLQSHSALAAGRSKAAGVSILLDEAMLSDLIARRGMRPEPDPALTIDPISLLDEAVKASARARREGARISQSILLDLDDSFPVNNLGRKPARILVSKGAKVATNLLTALERLEISVGAHARAHVQHETARRQRAALHADADVTSMARALRGCEAEIEAAFAACEVEKRAMAAEAQGLVDSLTSELKQAWKEMEELSVQHGHELESEGERAVQGMVGRVSDLEQQLQASKDELAAHIKELEEAMRETHESSAAAAATTRWVKGASMGLSVRKRLELEQEGRAEDAERAKATQASLEAQLASAESRRLDELDALRARHEAREAERDVRETAYREEAAELRRTIARLQWTQERALARGTSGRECRAILYKAAMERVEDMKLSSAETVSWRAPPALGEGQMQGLGELGGEGGGAPRAASRAALEESASRVSLLLPTHLAPVAGLEDARGEPGVLAWERTTGEEDETSQLPADVDTPRCVGVEEV